MFESLKKNKTLRSLLAASALFGAGALGAKAAEPAAPSAKEAVQTKVDDPLGARLNLMKSYQILTEALENNLCYCYSDKGVPTCGSGVHFRDFYDLKDVEAVKVTFKKGYEINLEDKAYLQKLADSVFKDLSSVKRFDGAVTARKVKLKDVKGGGNPPLPKGTRKKWNRSQLVLIPSDTLEGINRLAAEKKVQTALRVHPNLLELPLLAQFVPVDLIYTMGTTGYKEGFPEFQKAVATGDLPQMLVHCSTYNDLRRTAIKQALLEVAILMHNNPNLPQEACINLFHNFVKVKHGELLKKHNITSSGKKTQSATDFNSQLVPTLEPVLFQGLDRIVRVGWRSEQGLTSNRVNLHYKKYQEKKQK